jgi:hypothetical protein
LGKWLGLELVGHQEMVVVDLVVVDLVRLVVEKELPGALQRQLLRVPARRMQLSSRVKFM